MSEELSQDATTQGKTTTTIKIGFRSGAYLAGALLLFIFAIYLMVSALSNAGSILTDVISIATQSPFNGLFIGLLITAVLQSSSTTTSLLVAFVASRTITVEAAVPIIMGANIGTTITSTIVSLGFINRKKEFRRAVAAGTYHDFFNILTALILFPIEYYNHGVTRISAFLAKQFFVASPAGSVSSESVFSFGLRPLTMWINDVFPNGIVLLILSVALLFLSILLFRKIVTDILKVRQPESFRRFFFQNPLKSFGWGVVLTGAIRSSTITTSLVVPIVAKNLVSLKKAVPFILGANIGTTVTAFIAVLLYPHSLEALLIAFVHLTFNVVGVLIFLPIPLLRNIPLGLAEALGQLTMKYRIAGFIYIIATFFLIPFLLIAVHNH